MKKYHFLVLLLYFCSIVLAQAACDITISPPSEDPVCFGTPLVAPSDPAYCYQWLKNGRLILNDPDATKPIFPVKETGNYSVLIKSSTCGTINSNSVKVSIIEEEAKFVITKTELQPLQSDCNTPLKVYLKNKSLPTAGVTYEWSITDLNGNPLSNKIAEFLYNDAGKLTNKNSVDPVLQLNSKGQYLIKLRMNGGACYNSANPDGLLDPIDVSNPNKKRDGRYVHQEQIAVGYPEVRLTNFQPCEGSSTFKGSDFATLNSSGGKLIKGSILWTASEGVSIDDPTLENPNITFTNPSGSYKLTLKFRNECGSSESQNGTTEINVTFRPRAEKPKLPLIEKFICADESYIIKPIADNSVTFYNFYDANGALINVNGPVQFYEAKPDNSTTYSIATLGDNGCESERITFDLKIYEKEVEIRNNITDAQTICENNLPATITGPDATVDHYIPFYQWEMKEPGEISFKVIPNENKQEYTPSALRKTTIYKRTVTLEVCNKIFKESNEVTIEVLPKLVENMNLIKADNEIVCEGTSPTLTGNTMGDNLQYVWQSSTTSETTGFKPAVSAPGSSNTDGSTFVPAAVQVPTWFRRMAKYASLDCDSVASEAIKINIEKAPAAPVAKVNKITTCPEDPAILEVNTITGFTYNWYTDSSGGQFLGTSATFQSPVVSTVTNFYVEAVNERGCASVKKTAITCIPFSAIVRGDTTVEQGHSVRLDAKGGKTYLWTSLPEDKSITDTKISNPVVTPSETTTYTVKVLSEVGCTSEEKVTVTVIPRIVLVNTFTPNGDNLNDTWEIRNIENYPEATIEIFNRWGNKLFESKGYNTPWNGFHKGSLLPSGAYYFAIRLKPNEKPITGSINLVR